jgi:hypothetical protein
MKGAGIIGFPHAEKLNYRTLLSVNREQFEID